MTPTPISPPGGGAVTPAALPGQGYVGSGICSGTAFTHQQSIYMSYMVSSEATVTNQWLPQAGNSVNGLGLYITVTYSDSIDQFSTSANDGSSCSNAANARDLHVLDFSAFEHTGDGMGLSGMITTSANGFERRWALPGDVAEQYTRTFRDAWFPLDEFTYTQLQSNNTVAKALIRSMVESVAAGGIQYKPVTSSQNYPGPEISPPIPKFNTNLIYI